MGLQSLAALHRLQAVESKLRGLKDQLRRKDRQAQTHRIRIKQMEDQLSARQEEIKHRKTQVAQLELDFKTKEVSIGAYAPSSILRKITRNIPPFSPSSIPNEPTTPSWKKKFWKNLPSSINSNPLFDELEKNLTGQRNEIAGIEGEYQQFKQDLEAQIDFLESEHETVAKEVSPNNLAVFQRVAEAHEGEAMAKILKPHPKEQEYICDGCNMNIPMEKVNALLTKEEIQLCTVCGRILFIAESEAHEAAKK